MRSHCTACPRTRARRSAPRSFTATAQRSGTRRRTGCTRRRRCWSSSFPHRGRVRRMKRLLIFSATVLLVVAGCGGGGSSSTSSSTSSGGAAASSGGGGGTQLKISADPNQLKFNVSQLSAKAGKVTITMENPSGLQHNVSIKGGVSASGSTVGQGGKSVVTATLKPGKYTFFCSVDGHEAAGMTGELDVS